MASTASRFARPLSVAEVRRVEGAAQSMHPQPPLMERAGRVVAHYALQMLDATPVAQHRALVLAGPGNNGGDALVAARELCVAGCRVDVIFAGDDSRLPVDACAAHDAWRVAGGGFLSAWPDVSPTLIIDGLLGIGIRRAPEGRIAELIRHANSNRAPILAIDIPSGLDADSGVAFEPTIRALRTVTFLGEKVGLQRADGPACAGDVVCDWLGCEAFAAATLG